MAAPILFSVGPSRKCYLLVTQYMGQPSAYSLEEWGGALPQVGMALPFHLIPKGITQLLGRVGVEAPDHHIQAFETCEGLPHDSPVVVVMGKKKC